MTDKPLQIFGTPEESAVEQIKNCLRHDQAVAGALMADNHLGYAMPIGGVVAYEDAVSPTGVGFDIGCGNKAVKTNLSIFDLGVLDSSGAEGEMMIDPAILKPIMREIQKKISFGVGRNSGENIDHPLFEDDRWQHIDEAFGHQLQGKAREQLGTVGSGNHYVDLLVDAKGNLWVANHFGSRGLGHTIASGFMAAAQNKDFTERVPEGEESVVLSTQTDLGLFYVEAMQLAGEYAYAGRDFVADQVLGILGAAAVEEVHNHHNFAWHENGCWVVRKGATPLTIEPAFIGGSMGDISVIVRGRTFADVLDETTGRYKLIEDLGNIGSAPHGAGRVMSRTAAAGKMRKMWVCQNRYCGYSARAEGSNARRLFDGGNLDTCPDCGGSRFKKIRMRDQSTAAIDWNEARRSLNERGIVVLGAGADESPGVYKNLATVLSAHSNIEILEVLQPVGVVMAGPDTRDPYKD